jgi:hypothetical protein
LSDEGSNHRVRRHSHRRDHRNDPAHLQHFLGGTVLKIIHHNSSEIGGRVRADVFGHDNKTITLHFDAVGGGVNTSFIIGNHMDARALAKMLTAAADAVDPPKQSE